MEKIIEQNAKEVVYNLINLKALFPDPIALQQAIDLLNTKLSTINSPNTKQAKALEEQIASLELVQELDQVL